MSESGLSGGLPSRDRPRHAVRVPRRHPGLSAGEPNRFVIGLVFESQREDNNSVDEDSNKISWKLTVSDSLPLAIFLFDNTYPSYGLVAAYNFGRLDDGKFENARQVLQRRHGNGETTQTASQRSLGDF